MPTAYSNNQTCVVVIMVVVAGSCWSNVGKRFRYEDVQLEDDILKSKPPPTSNISDDSLHQTECITIRFTVGSVWALRLTEVRIDKHTVRGNMSRLECKFDLQGESLYSVKWYKDGHEFYRYLPRDTPPGQVFPLSGVRVVQGESNESQVTIGPLELSSSGRYRCEVSAEAPSFQTVSDHGDMLTVALPDRGPQIEGGKPRYQIGDRVKVNCTSGPSKPAAQLQWYINGVQANHSNLRGPRIRVVDQEGLEETLLGLEFRVERWHFRKGDLKLKCLASIGTVYWNSNEESVEGERPQRPPALEVKDTKPHVSRADRALVSSRAAGRPTFPGLVALLAAIFATR